MTSTIVSAQEAPFSRADFDTFLAGQVEPRWLTDRRQAAWELYDSMAWPGRREEEWSRTDIRLFDLKQFSPPRARAVEASSERHEISSREALLSQGVVLDGFVGALDGHPTQHALGEAMAAKGVIFLPLGEAATRHPDLVRGIFEKNLVPAHADRFAALNAAFWTSGALLYVPRRVVIENPLHVIATLTSGAVDLSRLVVVLEEGAEATLLTELASTESTGKGLHCGSIEIHLGASARLRFVSLQNWGTQVWHFAHHKARLERDASLQWTSGALGSRLSKVNQHVLLAGVGAESQVNGVMFTEGKQHLSYHTLQHHQAPHCRSDFLYKAALQDASRTVWRGMIKVDPGAQKTDGYQRNDNLLLSNQARADSIPGLEIEADDVRCTHGSTSGRVDEELIFYAQSRGFTRREAVRMIVAGFFQQVFDRITIESVREALGMAIGRRVREYA